MSFGSDFKVEVHTTQNRGFTPEEIAERCAQKIIFISATANPEIQAQAYAFRKSIVKTLVFYLREAIKSDRTTLYNALEAADHKDIAEIIRRL